MITEILAATNFGLAVFDSWLTRRRMRDYGVGVELNRSIRWFTEKVGVEFGPALGIVGMAVIQSARCVAFNASWILGILIGIRGKLFLIQLDSLAFEKKAKAIRAELERQYALRNSESSDDTLPSAAPSAPSRDSEPIKDEHVGKD